MKKKWSHIKTTDSGIYIETAEGERVHMTMSEYTETKATFSGVNRDRETIIVTVQRVPAKEVQ